MPNILVDPVLLTVSEEFTTDQQKAEYLQLLDSWAEAASQSKGYAWSCSSVAVHLLQAHRIFPDLTTLQQLLHAYNIVSGHSSNRSQSDRDTIDIRRIHAWIRHMIDENFDSKFELTSEAVELQAQAAGYSQLDVEGGKTIVQPAQIALRWHESIKQEMYDLFGKMCGCAYINHPLAADLLIVTKALAGGTNVTQSGVITVQTTISYIPLNQPANTPLTLQEQDIFHDFTYLTSSAALPTPNEWQWDGTEVSLRAAIEREYEKRYRNIIEELQRARQAKQGKKKAAHPGNVQLPFAYTFGSHFIKELNTRSDTVANENLPARFVEAAAAIIADQIYTGSFNPKQLRMSIGGGTRVYKRGNDKGHRIYITFSRGGWRLNYWKGPDASGRERIEFSIVQKEEEEVKIYYD